MESFILVVPIAMCAVAGLVCYLLNRRLRVLSGLIALAAAAVALFEAVHIYVADPMKYLYRGYSLKLGGLTFEAALRSSAFSGLLLLTVTFIGVIILIYSLYKMRHTPEPGKYYAFTLWALAGACTALLADNWLFFLFGWEIVTLMLFLLINLGGAQANMAAAKTFVMLGFADAAILLSIVLLLANGQPMDSMSALHGNPVQTTNGIAVLAYLLLLAGALAKAGAMPLHTWVPVAADAAPAPVAAFLPASLDKILGIYLLARISLEMFTLSEPLKLVLLIIGALTIICAVFMAMVQHSLRKLLGYHAVSQVGYMVLGIGTGLPIGILGGLFHMINNAVYKCCLFLGAGSVEDRTGQTDLDKLGGLAKAMPVTFVAMLVAALSISGVPPLNGYVSKWMVYQAAIGSGTSLAPLLLAVAVFGSGLTLASFIKVLHSLFFSVRPEGLKVTRGGIGTALMGGPMLVLAGICILFGVWASLPAVRMLGPALTELNPDLHINTQLVFNNLGGLWQPGAATVLILAGLALGVLIYLVGKVYRTRTVPAFMAGEVVRDDRVRFRATSFYRTVQELPVIGTMLTDASSGTYDVYYLGAKYGSDIVETLRSWHTGVLPLYVTWALVGLVLILLILV